MGKFNIFMAMHSLLLCGCAAMLTGEVSRFDMSLTMALFHLHQYLVTFTLCPYLAGRTEFEKGLRAILQGIINALGRLGPGPNLPH